MSRQQSVEMHEAIRRCNCRSTHLVYENVGHGDFVIDWQVGNSQEINIVLAAVQGPFK